MPSCAEVLAGLADYLDDEAAGSLRQEIEAHLAHCRTCQVIYDSTRRTLRITTESGTFDLSHDVSEDLVARILAAVQKKD